MLKSVSVKMWVLNAEKFSKFKSSNEIRCMKKTEKGNFKGFQHLSTNIQTLAFVTPVNKCLQCNVFQSSGLNIGNFFI